MSSLAKRFYLFTGKGGVGKTTVAQAWAKKLHKSHANVAYYQFTTSSVTENSSIQKGQTAYLEQFGIKVRNLVLAECAEEYIGKKLNSPMIASWIVKTGFFQALINMLPGFGHLIYMGKVLEELTNDPGLVAVLDAPASGHTLTMLESTTNFREIFSSGVLFEDTQKMFTLLHDPSFMQVVVVTIPTSMAINEALELKSLLDPLTSGDSFIICNNQLSLCEELKKTTHFPDFLKKKIELETEALKESQSFLKIHLPLFATNDPQQLISDMEEKLP